MFYKILVGDFGDFAELQTPLGLLTWSIFLAMTLLMMIIMLNLLVAILGDTYDKVIGSEVMTNTYERTKIITNIEKNMSRKEKLSVKRSLENFLVVAYTKAINSDEDSSIDFGDRIRSKIEKIEKKVLVLEKMMTIGFSKINRNDKYFFEFVSKKFDKANEKLKLL